MPGHHGAPTKSGDAPLTEVLFMAAGAARRVEPTLAARLHTVNDIVIAYGTALVDDRGRFGTVKAHGLDGVLFARIGE